MQLILLAQGRLIIAKAPAGRTLPTRRKPPRRCATWMGPSGNDWLEIMGHLLDMEHVKMFHDVNLVNLGKSW